MFVLEKLLRNFSQEGNEKTGISLPARNNYEKMINELEEWNNRKIPSAEYHEVNNTTV